ncbi:NAD-dependent deacylase [Halobacteriovorax sp. HFRX-2_2]|uniref:NAD-dependent deacylase n=1 Tax=unclassified Halobacteriovorax TaxID=2639665 RepID=UPI00371E25A1
MKFLKDQALLAGIKNICILTGAGISKESGLKTFRDQNGLWENHDIYEVASPLAFNNNPNLVHEFYNQRRRQLQSGEVHPNDAHQALADLEKSGKFKTTIITQNVDNLHERSGSKNIFHMHGQLLKVRCKKTKKIYEWKDDLTVEDRCQCCHTKGNLRPHIVWFGEVPLYLDEIQDALLKCDLFISIGTSGLVYPAANFVAIAKSAGAHCLEINPHPTNNAELFDETIAEVATQGVRHFVESMLQI